MRILLDSNAYTYYAQSHREVVEHVEAAGEVLLSTVVLGELLQGFRGGARFTANNESLDRFLSAQKVRAVDVTAETADWYARISVQVRTQGRPIPTNDIWIAAHTMETGAELVSADRHFEHVDGIAWTRLT